MKATGRSAANRAGRFRPLSPAILAVAAALSSASAMPAQAYQLGDFLKGVGSQVTSHLPATTTPQTKPPTAATASPDASGAMGLQNGTTTAPLHRLGTDAVAVIESASGTTAVREMDYVFAKQTISLGPKGAVTMSYLSGCLTEVIQGGVVTVASTGSKVAGGKLQTKTTPGCRAATPVVLASASEAGATVNRITPFSNANWNERALKSASPVFKWDKALGAVTLRVKDMDKEGEPVIWQGGSDQDWAAYPAGAVRLAPGEPYKVEALAGDKVVASALFSIDPALDVADSLANRVVPLSAS